MEKIKILAIQIESDTKQLEEDAKEGMFKDDVQGFIDKMDRISKKVKEWGRLVGEYLNKIDLAE